MKKAMFAAGLFSIIIFSSAAFGEVFDVSRDYTCDQPSSGSWYFEGYRESDGAYLQMVYGHPDIKEVSKYGVNSHYLPDGRQAFYPFVTRFDNGILVSPATSGARHDAVIAWEAPSDGSAKVTGSVRLLGNIRGEAKGKKVRAKLIQGRKVLWTEEIADGAVKDFSAAAQVARGEKLRLHIENEGDASANLALVNIRVETP